MDVIWKGLHLAWQLVESRQELRIFPMSDCDKAGESSTLPPILRDKTYDQPSVFLPENLLREARRQRNVTDGKVPRICVLDPDGDIVRRLLADGRASRYPHWPCYHTDMHTFDLDGVECGIISCVVGASFAVLVAEELFACGCELLVSVTSAGQILDRQDPPYFVLANRALRDEGTSYHYLAPSDWAYIDDRMLAVLGDAFSDLDEPVHQGAVWTTDAPFRETSDAIDSARSAGILAVEMEAAALYAFARARAKPVVCFAHITNQMARNEGDFEKGADDGTRDALAVISATARAWLSQPESGGKASPG